MSGVHDVVFLVDVDNTLLDNDMIISDIMQFLEEVVGPDERRHYWRIFDDLRAELGYSDYLGALQRYRIAHPRGVHLLQLSSFLVNYPFATRLFPGALEVIEHLGRWGPVVILSDGDVVFQPLKVERSGISAAVDRRVLIYIHKEEMLEDVEQRYPARRYVMVDDKLRILAEMQTAWGSRLTTVFPQQGQYARDATLLARYPAADLSVESIGDILALSLAAFAKEPGSHR